MAISLKEQYGINEFCGYTSHRDSYNYLKSQKDLVYNNLLLDEEIYSRYKTEKLDLDYVNRIEKEYGIPNLWPYISIDRVLMFNQLVREYPHKSLKYTHEELIRIFQVYAKAVIEMLEKEKPDFIFINIISSLGSTLIYHIAKKKGIKTYILATASTKTRYLLSEEYDKLTDANKLFEEYSSGNPKTNDAEQFLNEFRQKPSSYSNAVNNVLLKQTSRLSQLQFLKPRNLWRSIGWYLKVLSSYKKQQEFKDYTYEMHPWYYIVDRIKRKVRNTIGVSDLYDEFKPEEPFAFYPLHHEPEIALLLYAPYFTDQLNLIRHIARSLPLEYKLYVKEHPAMVSFRPRKYYKELKKIPNVKLIDPSINSFRIIPHTKLITTITGSVGWEATLLKKPVIYFGDYYFNHLPAIKKCENIKDLPYLVEEQLKNFEHNEKELLNFLQAIIDKSVSVDLVNLWEDEWDMNKKREGMQPLTDLLAKKLGLTKIV
ncbi:MAG: hypothetical protein Q8P20_03895 [bacterium]|nr:hypothetical protein [bacterium]